MLPTHLNMIKFLLLLGLTQIYAADNDITISVYTVTSKSMTVRWTKYEGASSYKVTATPKNSPEDRQVFAQFGGTTAMGSVIHLVPDTVYTMQVEAMDNALNALSSAQAEHTTAPEIPTIEQVYSKQSDSITVEFTEVSGASGYILRAENDELGFFSETAVSGSPSTVLQLRPYTDYTLSVMSVNAGGRSQPSYTVDARTVLVAPRVVTSSPSNASIVVSWSPVEHAVQYTLSIIQQGTDNRTVLNTTEQTVLVEELEAGETYCIKTTAWDAEGRTGDDITVCQSTRPPRPDSPGVSWSYGPGRGQEMSLYWNTCNGADSYVAVSNMGQNCSTTETSCIIAPLECGQVHSISVTAENEAGPSYPSEPRGVVTFPCAPEDLWVQENEPGSCRVAWSNVSLADFYVAFIKRDDGAEYHCNTTRESCHFPCICGYTFLTTIFAYNEAGSSPQGKVLNYTTVPCCPEDVAVTLASTETLEITWQPVRGAELYETTAAQTDDVIHCNDTAPVCALSDLQCNTLYSVVVTPCSELRGCNLTCTPHTQETAPCAPEIINVTQTNAFSLQTALTTVRVLFTNPNSAPTNYTVTATGRTDSHSCHVSQSTSCELTELPCGTKYEVMAVAITGVGHSLPSFTLPLETGPCCPSAVNVEQITQAMTNVTWSPSNGARSYITSLTSPRGHAKCHTLETHCMMGCITCGTNYSVSLEALSSTGHKSQCNYQGFPSSACCPTGIKLYKMDNTSLRIYWRSSGRMQSQNYTVDLSGTGANYTCSGNSFCDLGEVMCGDVYTVVVAPVGQNGNTVSFCPRRMYSVSCSGGNIGMVIYRGKRSVD